MNYPERGTAGRGHDPADGPGRSADREAREAPQRPITTVEILVREGRIEIETVPDVSAATAAYIRLGDSAVASTVWHGDRVSVDLDADGQPVGVEILGWLDDDMKAPRPD